MSDTIKAWHVETAGVSVFLESRADAIDYLMDCLEDTEGQPVIVTEKTLTREEWDALEVEE